MKRRALLISGTIILITAIATGLAWCSPRTVVAESSVEIDDRNFPDAFFRNAVSTSYDTNSDGSLSFEEIAAVKEITLIAPNIANLKGVAFFTSLERLVFRNTQVKSVYLDNNTKLKTLICPDNQLESLYVGGNTKLEYLDCSNNQLQSLDLRKNSSLTNLYCDDNKISSLDLSSNTMLTTLSAAGNGMETLKTAPSKRFRQLKIQHNSLSSLDVSQLSRLESLNCSYNSIQSLDLSRNTNLVYLNCISNKIKELDVENNVNLTELYCYSNSIQSINVCCCPALVDAVENGTQSRKRSDEGVFYNHYLLSSGDEIKCLSVSLKTKVITVFPPDVPTNVKAEAQSATSIKITWTPVDGATGYTLLQASTPDAPIWKQLSSGISLDRYVNNLTAGDTYYFKLAAYKNVDGVLIEGNYCDPIEITLTAPAPQNVKGSTESTSSIKVSWDSVEGATGYQVWRAENTEGSFVAVGSVTDTYRVCTGLHAGTQYRFKVRAYTEVDGKKVFGKFSRQVAVFTKPNVPKNVKTTVVSDTKARVSWSEVNGATGYEVYRSTSKDGTYSRLGEITSTQRDCPSLITGTTYYFKVRAFITDNGKKIYSGFSAIVSAIPKPSAPTGVKATVLTATKVNVSWNKVTNATGYVVYRSISKDGPYSKLGVVTTTDRDCPGLKTGTTYYFKVRAYKTVNGTKIYGNYSAVVSAVPKA